MALLEQKKQEELQKRMKREKLAREVAEKD